MNQSSQRDAKIDPENRLQTYRAAYMERVHITSIFGSCKNKLK